jgi:hypothetical protein
MIQVSTPFMIYSCIAKSLHLKLISKEPLWGTKRMKYRINPNLRNTHPNLLCSVWM